MPKKRRNNGRNKKHKGHSDPIHCENCKRLVPKDKAIKRFLIKNMVDQSSKRDIEESSIYGKDYTMPRLYIKNQYCVSCGIHARIVRVRSNENRRIRYISNFREGTEEASNGLYKKANVRNPKKQENKNNLELEQEENNDLDIENIDEDLYMQELYLRLAQMKQERKEAQANAKLLDNRLNLLKGEEKKAWKKIEEEIK